MSEIKARKILVADDSRTISLLLQSVLTQAGYQVEPAYDGLEALQKVYQTLPDLIVLDILMPKMNGYQVCRLLKDDPQTATIPIIMLSAKTEQKDKFWGLYTGADSYLTKTKNIAEILQGEIETIFRNQPPEKKDKPLALPSLNQDDLIQRLNNLLDDLLFHAVLINEIQNRSQVIADFVLLNQELLILLSQVIHFQLGVLYFFDEDSGTIHSYLAFQDLPNKHIMEQVNNAIIASGLKVPLPESLDDFSYHVFPEPPQEVTNLPAVSDQKVQEIRVRGLLRGILLMQRYDQQLFSEEEETTLNFFLKHAAGVLDNALLYRKTQQLAVTDGLTHLYNHRYFQEALKDELNRSRRFRRPLSLIMIDIDHFKHFNDTYGHQEGDVILKELAHILHKNVRSIEIVSRYGGEEFAIILPETDSKDGKEIAERLRKKVEEHHYPIMARYPQEKITISLGVATFPSRADNQVDLIRNADQALYLAKNAGRNRVFADENLNEPGNQ